MKQNANLYPSPVPAYTIFPEAAIVEIAIFGRRSLTGLQLAPPSEVFQIPPATAPARRLVELKTMIERVRPPTSLFVEGPMWCQTGPEFRLPTANHGEVKSRFPLDISSICCIASKYL